MLSVDVVEQLVKEFLGGRVQSPLKILAEAFGLREERQLLSRVDHRRGSFLHRWHSLNGRYHSRRINHRPSPSRVAVGNHLVPHRDELAVEFLSSRQAKERLLR